VLEKHHPQCKVKSKSSWQCVSCGSKPACGSECCVCVPECLTSHTMFHVIRQSFSSSIINNFRLMGQIKFLSTVCGAGSGAGRQCLSALPLRWLGSHTKLACLGHTCSWEPKDKLPETLLLNRCVLWCQLTLIP